MEEVKRQEVRELFKKALLEKEVECFDKILAEAPDVDLPPLERDPSGTLICPGHPKLCLGSGYFAPMFECCCDECDHLDTCYPQKASEAL